MITKNELIEYAKIKNLNLGQAELDYIQNIILFILSKNNDSKIIFKGGTALYKVHNLDRFSEDLDFTADEELNFDEKIKEIVNTLERFGIFGKIIEKKQYKDSIKIIMHFEGPLYINTITSKCKIIMDFSLREKLILKPDYLKINHIVTEIPIFNIFVMKLEEILAEKIRAIMTRKKARDVYDIYYLCKKGIKFNKEMTNKKLKFYKIVWSYKQFMLKINEKEEIWNNELKHLVDFVPDPKECFKFIKTYFK
ncbi:MAG: nucleotidyl transferase AbiEii/AbiGii toxin family protein [Candidatus Woesearchaeota archaeon]